MKDNVWFVAPGSERLESAYEAHPEAKRIENAQAFTAEHKTVMVAEDLEGFLRGGNDVLIITWTSLGEQPKVQRVHYYEDTARSRQPKHAPSLGRMPQRHPQPVLELQRPGAVPAALVQGFRRLDAGREGLGGRPLRPQRSPPVPPRTRRATADALLGTCAVRMGLVAVAASLGNAGVR